MQNTGKEKHRKRKTIKSKNTKKQKNISNIEIAKETQSKITTDKEKNRKRDTKRKRNIEKDEYKE